MKKIKVLEVIRQGEIGGGESHLIDLVKGFNDDIEPIILSFTKGRMIDVLTSHNIVCHVIETKTPFNILIQKKIIKLINDNKIDIIHAHGSRAASNILIAAKITKTPVIYTVHGWSFHNDQKFIIRKLRIWSEKLICNNCQQVICVSENNRQQGLDEFSLRNCTVIENGINLDKFNPNKVQEVEELLCKEGNKRDEIIVAFIGRITTQKAPFDFIDSIALAHKQEKNIKGLLIGEGDLKAKVEEYVSLNKYNSFIQIEKFRNDIPNVLKSIDVFVLPSLWEGLSIALIEAMAMKKAIVATPTDGTREIIIDHKNGIIVPYHSPDKLADAYIEYYNSKEKMSSYGQEAFELVEKRFNSKRVSEKVTELYKSIIK